MSNKVTSFLQLFDQKHELWPRPPRLSVCPVGFDRVIAACLADALDAFGVAERFHPLRGWLLRRLLRLPAQRIAEQMLIFDAIVGARGLQQGGTYAVDRLVGQLTSHGDSNVPKRGPLLLVSNHPGLADAVALFAQLPRADLKVIAACRPLLAALPEIARHLIFVPEDRSSSIGLVREATHYLRRGGAVLTFPAGRIEPDPAIRRGALAAVDRWSTCVDSFARLVPDLTIVPVIVSGVLSPAALHHPLTRLRRGERNREWLAANLQMLVPALGGVTTNVLFGAPIRVETLCAGQSVGTAVKTQARQLMMACEAGRKNDS